jgi:hypothetical protein
MLAAAVLLATAVAHADDRQDYNRRAAERFAALFQSLDRDGNGSLTLAEAHGDLNLGPRFNDMDIDRDGIVTRAELQRFVSKEFEIELTTAR